MDLTGIVALPGTQHLLPCRQSLAYETGPLLCCRGCLLYRLDHERMWRHSFLFSGGNSPLLELFGKFQ